ncbi:MAG: TonB-dependent receptor [candidate division WOR-3 bacterium]|nr:MAG: TonB-dependent receptor [candidate division WOR-3 bacterium]
MLHGRVRETGSGVPLPYVTVLLPDAGEGASTDERGQYRLRTSCSGPVRVEFSAVGYRPFACTLDLAGTQVLRLDVGLELAPVPVSGVVCSAERARSEREVGLSIRRLAARDLAATPAMVEPDVFRSFQSIPGVLSVSDFSSALYVRGGSPDQNAVLLDGVPLYNPFHLSSLFSTFNTDALERAELYAGAFPAHYGHAISSAVDVTTRRGNSERLAGRWDVGLVSSRLLLEGPLPRGSFLVSGRRAYTEIASRVVAQVSGDTLFSLPYYFYDLQSRVDFDPTFDDHLSLVALYSRDAIDSTDERSSARFHWGNGAFSLRWRHLFPSGLGLTTQASYSGSDASLRYLVRSWFDDSFKTKTASYGLRSDARFVPDSLHELLGGWEVTVFDLSSRRTRDTTVWWDNAPPSPVYAGVHLGDKWRPLSGVLVQPGVRAEYFSSGSHFRVSPRLSAKKFLGSGFSVSAGLGRYYQYLSTPFPRDELLVRAPALFFQQLVPADSVLAPARADHLVLGAEKWLTGDIRVSAEAYYKRMQNLLETDLYFDPSDEPDFDPLELYPIGLVNAEADIRSGTGRSAGLDILLRSSHGWVGYSLAFARRRFLGDEYYPVFDARHNITLAGTIGLGRGWAVSLQWLLRTGFPDTGPVGWYHIVITNPVTGERFLLRRPLRDDRLRYPAYHRLDTGVEKSFSLLGLEITAYLQVANVYARQNVLWYSHNQGKREPFVLLPLPIPSLGLRGRF